MNPYIKPCQNYTRTAAQQKHASCRDGADAAGFVFVGHPECCTPGKIRASRRAKKSLGDSSLRYAAAARLRITSCTFHECGWKCRLAALLQHVAVLGRMQTHRDEVFKDGKDCLTGRLPAYLKHIDWYGFEVYRSDLG